MELFEKIEIYGSIKKASEAMGMSYTKALRIIRTAEEELGHKLVISTKGGNTRGRTLLTFEGKQVLATFRDIYLEVSAYAERLFDDKFKKLSCR